MKNKIKYSKAYKNNDSCLKNDVKNEIYKYEKQANNYYILTLIVMIFSILSFISFVIFSIILCVNSNSSTNNKTLFNGFLILSVLPFILFVVNLVFNTKLIFDYIKYLKLKPNTIKDYKMLKNTIFTLVGTIFSTATAAGSISLLCWVAK